MSPNNHLTDEEVMDLVSGRLNEAGSASANAHVAGCGRCAAEAAFWSRATDAATQRHTVEPPANVLRRAAAIFDPTLLPVPAWKRLIASLIFDSRAQTALAGVRDAGASFQLLCQVEDVEVDLLCEPAQPGWRITGQVVGLETGGGATARLIGSESREAALSEQGEFTLLEVPEGDVALELETADVTIALPPFVLGGQSD